MYRIFEPRREAPRKTRSLSAPLDSLVPKKISTATFGVG